MIDVEDGHIHGYGICIASIHSKHQYTERNTPSNDHLNGPHVFSIYAYILVQRFPVR